VLRLRDGSRVSVRAASAADEPALGVLLKGLGEEARRLRFFTAAVDLSGAAHHVASTDAGRFGLVAHDETGLPVGHALYARLAEPTRAEVAVEVADHLHGRGLGTQLIAALATVAERHGITRFVAEVLPENHAMLAVFRDGFDARCAVRDGVEMVEFPTAAWRLAGERFGAH